MLYELVASSLPDCEIKNKGISGDTLAGGCACFQKDVIEPKPDIVISEYSALTAVDKLSSATVLPTSSALVALDAFYMNRDRNSEYYCC